MKNYFIKRNEQGEIESTFRRPQFSGQEKLPEDNQEIIDFKNRPVPELTNEEIYDQTMKNNKLIKALAISLNKSGAFSSDGVVLTNSALRILVKSNM